MTLDFDRHCAEIVTQTSLLVGHLDCADLTVPVPTCPGWNVSQLARHVEGGQRWADEIVGTRVGLHATDADAHWLLDLTGDVIAWQRADKQAAAEIRAPVTDQLLTIYRRRRVAGLDVTGDAKLVDFWLERVAFG
jgi:hypothetical protein